MSMICGSGGKLAKSTADSDKIANPSKNICNFATPSVDTLLFCNLYV